MEKLFKFELINHNPSSVSTPSHKSMGSLSIKYPIKVFTEISNLKAVIVGYMDDSSQYPEDPLCRLISPNYVPQSYPQKIIKRAQEIQNFITKKLMELGIEVIRPGVIDHTRKYTICEQEGNGFHTFSPRDLIFYYHDSLYECPSPLLCRQYETDAYQWVANQQRELGGKWYASWKGIFNPNDPYFEAAQIMRIGLDILYLVSAGGNELGYDLFSRFINEKYQGKVRVHALRNLYEGFHIDSTFVTLGYNKILKKNVLLANGERTDPTNIPVIFRGENWIILENNDVVDVGFEPGFEICTKWIGQNFLVINPHLVMIEETQISLITMLEHYQIETIKVPCEIGRSVGGGIHCMTNDYCREEEHDFAAIIESSKNSKEELAGYFDKNLLELLNKEGDIDQWQDIANKMGIFPMYAKDHLTKEQVKEINLKHLKCTEKFGNMDNKFLKN